MSCTFDRERLSEYFDGELNAADRGEAESHISACSECLRELGELKAAAQLVKGLPAHRAPASVAEGVSRGLASAPPPASAGGRVHSFSAWKQALGWGTAAAAALLIAANLVYFSSSPATSPEPQGDAMATAPKLDPNPNPNPFANRSGDFQEEALRREQYDEKKQGLANAPARGAGRPLAEADLEKSLAQKSEFRKAPSTPPAPSDPSAAPSRRAAEPQASKPAPDPAPEPAPKPNAVPSPETARLDAGKDTLKDPLSANVPGAATLPPTLQLEAAAKADQAAGRMRAITAEAPAVEAKSKAGAPAPSPVRLVCVTPDAVAARARILASLGSAGKMAAADRTNKKRDAKEEAEGAAGPLTLSLTSAQLEALHRDLARDGLALVPSGWRSSNRKGGQGGFGDALDDAVVRNESNRLKTAGAAPADAPAETAKEAEQARRSAAPSARSARPATAPAPATAAPVEPRVGAKVADEASAEERDKADPDAQAKVHTVVIEFFAPESAPAKAAEKKDTKR